MKKTFLLTIVLIINYCNSSAQSIQNIQAYFKFDGTRYIAQMSNNTLWWFDKSTWQEIPRKNLPEKQIKFIDAYLKISMGLVDTRIIAVMDDNSIWWYANDEQWEKIENEGLPNNKTIKDFKAYLKTGMMGTTETRFVAVLNDNSVWWYDAHKWKNLSLNGLPENTEIQFLRTYQKTEMMGGTETRYMVKLNDNSLWWCSGNKWKQIESTGLPSKQPFKQFEVYMKNTGGGMMAGVQEGRFIAVLEDNSIWWFAANSKSWAKLSVRGLPEGYNIKSLKPYQKYGGLTGESRLVVLLADGTLWWYAEGKAWTPVSIEGLPKNN